MHNGTGWSKSRGPARSLKAGMGALVGVFTIAGVALNPIGTVGASAATSVSNVSAQVSPTTAGAGGATYTVEFRTGSSGSLAGGSQITLTAPNGTALPSYASGYSISDTGGSIPVGAVTTAQVAGPGSATTSGTFNQADITLAGPASSTPVGDNDRVTVVIHPAANPIQASATDAITVSTSSDSIPAQSGTYTITPGPAAAFISPQGSEQSASVGTQFAKQLGVTVVDAYGNPVPGAAVTFTAPASSATQPAASGAFDHLSSTACSATLPSNPPPGDVCVVTADAAGKATASPFTADGTSGSYTVAATSQGVSTYSFALTNCSGTCPPSATQVSPGSVTVSPQTAGATGATYTVSFTTTSAGPGTGGTIKLVAPSGTVFSSHVADYSVSVGNGHLAVVSGVSATPGQVVITLGLSSIGAGDLVTIRVAKSSLGLGVTNPTAAAYSYQIQVSTSADSQAAYTTAYSVAAGSPAAVSAVSGDNQTALIGRPFASPLVAAVTDQYGNPVGGAQVTFTTPANGASSTWTNGTDVEADTTSATGQAESSVPAANSTPGGPYQVSATGAGGANGTPAAFHLTNVAQALKPSAPRLSSVAAGAKGVGYSLPFTTSSTGALGPGATITVLAPAGTDFSSSNASDYSITVGAGHSATVGQVTPSSTTGSSTRNQVVIALKSSSIAPGDAVTVTIAGVTNPTAAAGTYSITESTSSDSVAAPTPDYRISAADPASISLVGGSGQTAQIGQRFDHPLVALVQDAYGNPVAGAQVTFTAPATGASAVFAGNSASETDPTGADGLATSSVPTANSSGGAYSVTASDLASNLSSGATYTLTNVAPEWSGWIGPATVPPPGLASPPSAPAVASWQAGRLDLFVEGRDASLWHRWSTDGGASWSGWENLGGVLADGPAAVSWGPDRIDILVRGTDGQLWHKWWDGNAWGGWEPLGGALASAPTVSSWSAGRLDVFVRGTDGAIWHKWWDGRSWNGWESRGGLARFSPAAVSWGPGRIDLFTVGTDGSMWHQVYSGASWTGWFQDVNLTFASGPGVCTWGPDRLDLFAASTTPGNPVVHLWFDGSWHAESLGGPAGSAPGVVSWGPNRIDTFAQDPDSNLWYQWYGF